MPTTNFTKCSSVGCAKDRSEDRSLGKPHLSKTDEELQPLIETNWVIHAKYDLNHSRHLPLIPEYNDSLPRRISWSTVSKAAVKSSKARSAHLLVSIAHKMSLVTLISAVSDLQYCLFGDWMGSAKLRLVICCCNCLATQRCIMTP